MNQKIYCIYDGGGQYFMPPFVAQADGQAVRMFIGSLGDSFPYRSDFILFRIGEFDSQNGVLVADEQFCVLRGNSIDPSLDPRVQVLSAPDLKDDDL